MRLPVVARVAGIAIIAIVIIVPAPAAPVLLSLPHGLPSIVIVGKRERRTKVKSRCASGSFIGLLTNSLFGSSAPLPKASLHPLNCSLGRQYGGTFSSRKLSYRDRSSPSMKRYVRDPHFRKTKTICSKRCQRNQAPCVLINREVRRCLNPSWPAESVSKS